MATPKWHPLATPNGMLVHDGTPHTHTHTRVYGIHATHSTTPACHRSHDS